MINAQFKLGGEITCVKVEGNGLVFMDVGTGMATPVEGLKFSRAGVMIEHPDLKDNPDWRKIAIERLKEYMKTYKLEIDKMFYVKDELIKFGYEPLHYQKSGFRPQKFNDK